MDNKLRVKNARFYKAAFNNNLALCGVEDGQPMFIGTDVEFSNFNWELNN